MMKTDRATSALVGLALLFTGVSFPVSAQQPQTATKTPLEIHMHHWLRGSREWRTDNPNYDPSAAPMTGGWFKEFAVRWDYGPHKQHLIGGIFAIGEDGREMKASSMYAFYDPVRNRVEQIQIGRTGTYSLDSAEARSEPTPFGEPEIGIAVEHKTDGSTTMRKHENTFHEDGRQLTNVYLQNEAGEWVFFRNWLWRLKPVSETESGPR